MASLVAWASTTWAWYWETLHWFGVAIAFLGAALILSMVFYYVMRARAHSADLLGPIYTKLSGIEEALKKYVLPRDLSTEQAQIIEDFLLKRDAQELTVVFEEGNGEANQFAAQLYNVFRQGGWKVLALEGREKVREGLRIEVVGPQDHGVGKTARDTIQRALQAAGMELDGSGWGSPSGVTSIKATLAVGHQRRR